MLANLNRIWLGSYVIRAFLPKHAREQGKVSDKATDWVSAPGKGLEAVKASDRGSVSSTKREQSGEGTSFADILRGQTRQSGSGRDTGGVGNRVVLFESLEGEKGWLMGAFTGRLKGSFSWKDHGEEIRSESQGSLIVTDMGDNLVLITSASSKSTRETLDGFLEWSSFWLSWFRPWDPLDANRRREFWTRWIGVPLHAWSGRFFKTACDGVGSLLEIHEVTKSRVCLEVAYVKIEAGLEAIDRVIECVIDGTSFRIRVEEIRFMDIDLFLKKGGHETESDSELSFFEEGEIPDDVSSDAGVFRQDESFRGEETVEGGEIADENWDAPDSGDDLDVRDRGVGDGSVLVSGARVEAGGLLEKQAQLPMAAASGDFGNMIVLQHVSRGGEAEGHMTDKAIGVFEVSVGPVCVGERSSFGPQEGVLGLELTQPVVGSLGEDKAQCTPSVLGAQPDEGEGECRESLARLPDGPGDETLSKGEVLGGTVRGSSFEVEEDGIGVIGEEERRRGEATQKKKAVKNRKWKKAARKKKRVEEERNWKPFIQELGSGEGVAAKDLDVPGGSQDTVVPETPIRDLRKEGKEFGLCLGLLDRGKGSGLEEGDHSAQEERVGLGAFPPVDQC